jgi:acyl dehydratase
MTGAAEISAKTDALRPMTELQVEQTRAFVQSLDEKSEPYWDVVSVGDVLERSLTITPELVILYADGVEDYTPWYEGWKMNTWAIEGESPFGAAVVPPMMMSHFVLSVAFDHTKPFSAGSIHTSHESTIHHPILVGTTVRIRSVATDKFVKRGRRYLRHQITVSDEKTDLVYFTEVRDTLSR